MATDRVSVSGPIDIESNSKQAVAFKLMQHIAGYENAPGNQMNTRQYWLTLYRQCYKATDGGSMDSIMRQEL